MSWFRGAALVIVGVSAGLVACENTGADESDTATTASGPHSSKLCPAWEPADGDACSAAVTCHYGSECCCGVCRADRICGCNDGAWGCGALDPCAADCADGSGADGSLADASPADGSIADLEGVSDLNEAGSTADALPDSVVDSTPEDAASDGASDGGEDAAGACPETPRQTGEACTGALACAWGEVCCCGACDAAYRCTCSAEGLWTCAFSDLCQTPECPDACQGDASDASDAAP